MKIRALAFGKIKSPQYRSLCDDYLGRIAAWTPIDEITLKPFESGPTPSAKERLSIQAKEKQILLENVRGSSIVLLDASGQSWSTERWAEYLEQSHFDANVCIGSTWGWDPSLLKSGYRVVSFGQQTMAHELARVVLYEQIYRALCLRRNHPYHFRNSDTVLV